MKRHLDEGGEGAAQSSGARMKAEYDSVVLRGLSGASWGGLAVASSTSDAAIPEV
jgi:hypothetical protein